MNDYRAQPRNTNDSPIARIRIERGLTQKELAQRVGCIPNDISRWERGIVVPRGDKLAALADALNCTVDALLARQ